MESEARENWCRKMAQIQMKSEVFRAESECFPLCSAALYRGFQKLFILANTYYSTVLVGPCRSSSDCICPLQHAPKPFHLLCYLSFLIDISYALQKEEAGTVNGITSMREQEVNLLRD
jgi:hypothetical protein